MNLTPELHSAIDRYLQRHAKDIEQTEGVTEQVMKDALIKKAERLIWNHSSDSLVKDMDSC